MRKFLPFVEALAVAQSLELASSTEWRAWCKNGMRPANVPSAPDKVYTHDGWQGWGHWLGTNNIKTKLFLPFEEAVLMARDLRLVGVKEWRAWCKSGVRPVNVPANPDKVYVHDGWLGWEHWLWHPDHDSARGRKRQRR